MNPSQLIPLSKKCSFNISTTQIGNPSKYVQIFKSCSDHIIRRILTALELSCSLMKKRGVYSSIEMQSAGFQYTGEGDTAYCEQCGLRLANWTLTVKPFTVHANERPDCPFVKTIRPERQIIIETNMARDSDDDSPANKRQKLDMESNVILVNPLFEVETLKQARKRSFSHWSKQMQPSAAEMIQAGFFNCNVGDRVICLYCNLICQQWSSCTTDDPIQVHRKLSPKCCFITALDRLNQQSSIFILNDQNVHNQQPISASSDSMRWGEVVYTTACHPAYTELPRREASFASWSKENRPSVDSLVRAGFFYAGTKSIVTCFYCNGSLQNWGANDDPKIEHARWFPNCAYAKQLCGRDLYDRIQATKRAQAERNRVNALTTSANSSTQQGNEGSLETMTDALLSRYVAARLDLPISQQLIGDKFRVSVVKRCWEDQLRLKHNDFQNPCDLFLACTILQKQIDVISGKKENIIIPSLAMEKLREGAENNNPPVEIVPASSIITTAEETNRSMTSTSSSTDSIDKKKIDPTEPPRLNECLVCFEDQKRLACMPCGHLVACVPCGHSLRTCPVCRRDIEAFVRIYL